jgi:hypothetical protein
VWGRKKKRPVGLGLAGEKGEKGRRKGKGRGRRKWAGPKEKEGKKKNLDLKFKFKWKASNRTMQCGIKCTRPVFPYISFYG